GPGAQTQNTPQGYSQNWQCAQSDDGDVSFVFAASNVLPDTDTYAITAPQRTEPITTVTVHNRSKAANAVFARVTPVLRIGNTIYNGSTAIVLAAYTDVTPFSLATN